MRLFEFPFLHCFFFNCNNGKIQHVSVKSRTLTRIATEIFSQTAEKARFNLSSFACQKHTWCSVFSPGQSRPVLPTDGHGRQPIRRFPGTPESRSESNGTARAAAELESVRHKAVHLYPEESRDRVGKLSTWDRERWGEGWGLCCDPCKVKVWRAAFRLWQNNSQLCVEGCHKTSLLRIFLKSLTISPDRH